MLFQARQGNPATRAAAEFVHSFIENHTFIGSQFIIQSNCSLHQLLPLPEAKLRDFLEDFIKAHRGSIRGAFGASTLFGLPQRPPVYQLRSQCISTAQLPIPPR